MATFTINGFQLRSNEAHVVQDVQHSEMQIVSPLGMSTLACSYAQKSAGNAEVSLADYNLIFDGIHLNDGQLPDKIELFNLTWGTQGGNYVSRVLNVVFKEPDGWRDAIFAVDQSPLPSLVSAAQANAFLGASRFSLVDTQDTFEIQLDQMPDVEIRGVLLKLFDADAADDDSFSFFQEFDALSAQADTTYPVIDDPEPVSEPLPMVSYNEGDLEDEPNDSPINPGVDEFDF